MDTQRIVLENSSDESPSGHVETSTRVVLDLVGGKFVLTEDHETFNFYKGRAKSKTSVSFAIDVATLVELIKKHGART